MSDQQPLEGAVADFRRITEVSLARIEGQLALVLQRQDQADRRADSQDQRADAQDAAVAKLDHRVDTVERTHVTRDDLEKRGQRTLAWTALIVTIALGLTATGTTVIISLVPH